MNQTQAVVAVAGPTVFTPQLTADERRLLDGVKVMADMSPFAFGKYVLKRDKLDSTIHRAICDYLVSGVLRKYGKPLPPRSTDWNGEFQDENIPRITRDSARSRKLLLAPRKGLKSTLMMTLAVWLPAVCDPSSCTMFVCETQPLADDAATEINGHLTGNVRLRYLYGEWNTAESESKRWQGRTKVYSCRKGWRKDPSLLATSVGAAFTGLHPEFVILDDLVSKDNIDSVEESAKVQSAHDAALVLDPDFVWIVGTRYGPNDLYGKRIMDELYDEYDVYVRAARNPDHSLWCPTLFSEEKLKELRKVWGDYLFESQMMNRVVSRAEHPLRSDLVKRYLSTDFDIPKRDDVVRLLWCDPGGARRTGHWGLVVLDFQRDQKTDEIHLWVRYAAAPAQTSKHAAEEFCSLWWTWKPDACGCEATGFSQSFIDDTLIPEMRRQSVGMRLTETKPGSISKPRRVNEVENSLGTMMERGVVHILRDSHSLWNEIAMFPSGTYDMLDATAAALKYAYEYDFFPRPAKKEQTRTTSDDYRRVLDDANRILGEERRRMCISRGVNQGDHILSEALRKVFRDASPRKQEAQLHG